MKFVVVAAFPPSCHVNRLQRQKLPPARQSRRGRQPSGTSISAVTAVRFVFDIEAGGVTEFSEYARTQEKFLSSCPCTTNGRPAMSGFVALPPFCESSSGNTLYFMPRGSRGSQLGRKPSLGHPPVEIVRPATNPWSYRKQPSPHVHRWRRLLSTTTHGPGFFAPCNAVNGVLPFFVMPRLQEPFSKSASRAVPPPFPHRRPITPC